MAKIAFATIGSVVLICASVTAAFAAKDARAGIEAANDQFEAAFAAGDAAGVAACYTEDGEIFPPGAEPSTGRDAIAAYWKGAMDGGVATVDLQTAEVEQHGDTAIEVGKAQIMDADKNVVASAKYIVIWKRVDGKWHLHRDIWN